MINPAHEEILPDDTFRRADKFSDVQVVACSTVLEDLSVGIRIVLEERGYFGAWRHPISPIRTKTVDGAAGAQPCRFASGDAICRRHTWKDSLFGREGRNHGKRGFAAQLAEA